MRLKQRPYNLLLLTAVVLFIAGLYGFNTPIDIYLHDTYFLFHVSFLMWIPTIILFTFWLLYLVTKRFLFSNKLIWTHVIFTISISLFILTLPYITTYSYGGIAGMPRRYYDYGGLNSFKIFGNLTQFIVPAFLVLIIAQLTYFINLFIGIYVRIGRHNRR